MKINKYIRYAGLAALITFIYSYESIVMDVTNLLRTDRVSYFIIEETREALLKCSYLQKNYPKEYAKIQNLKVNAFKSEIFNQGNRYCGEYIRPLNIILLTKAAYTDRCGISVNATLGHEIMHQIGMPDHVKEGSLLINDEIYLAEFICFNYMPKSKGAGYGFGFKKQTDAVQSSN